MQIGEFLINLPTTLGPQLTTLLALIFAQLLFAVAVAIRDKRFEWGELADFYRSRVLPYGLGYITLIILSRYASVEMLGADAGALVADGVAWAGWLVLVGSLAGKIFISIKALYGTASPVKTPAELIDMMTAELEKAQAVAAEVPAEKPEELSKVYEDPKVSETPREQEDV